MREAPAQRPSHRVMSIWKPRSESLNELQLGATKMFDDEHIIKPTQNVIVLWDIMRKVKFNELEDLQPPDAHAIVLGTLPYKIGKQRWSYAISVAGSHGCLLCLNDNGDADSFLAEMHARDRRWIGRCSRPHPEPKLISIGFFATL